MQKLFVILALIVKLTISQDYVTDGYNYFGDSITTETEPVLTNTLETSPDSESEDYPSATSSKGESSLLDDLGEDNPELKLFTTYTGEEKTIFIVCAGATFISFLVLSVCTGFTDMMKHMKAKKQRTHA
ncbi:hypothetical protein WR25_23858 [Diploscapter pachys]|uniref:Syndecan/Neurexin domain-containing protein n=1 Tax=Diploscapter pachys TaxID=2018661 RepID=A0A2A2J4F8_9BILA|nr:hypothetical protein WR25_23858 [Diploscapter pachys]